MPTERQIMIQTQLEGLLHAKKCSNPTPCSQQTCATLKAVLDHMNICTAGTACQEAHCASSRQILSHWENCQQSSCSVCIPLRHNYQPHNVQNAQHNVQCTDLTNYNAESNIVHTIPDYNQSPNSNNWYNNNNYIPQQQDPNQLQHMPYTNNTQSGHNNYVPPPVKQEGNLSPEMMSAIQSAVCSSINSMLPTIEETVKRAVRSELSFLLQRQPPPH